MVADIVVENVHVSHGHRDASDEFVGAIDGALFPTGGHRDRSWVKEELGQTLNETSAQPTMFLFAQRSQFTASEQSGIGVMGCDAIVHSPCLIVSMHKEFNVVFQLLA